MLPKLLPFWGQLCVSFYITSKETQIIKDTKSFDKSIPIKLPIFQNRVSTACLKNIELSYTANYDLSKKLSSQSCNLERQLSVLCMAELFHWVKVQYSIGHISEEVQITYLSILPDMWSQNYGLLHSFKNNINCTCLHRFQRCSSS